MAGLQCYRCCICRGLTRDFNQFRFEQRGGQFRPRCENAEACRARRDAGRLPEVWLPVDEAGPLRVRLEENEK